MKLVETTDPTTWNAFVNGHPSGHPLQLWGWGEAKRAGRWTAHRLLADDGSAGAQVLLWPIPKTGWQIAYVPRGPVVAPTDSAELLDALVTWAKGRKILYLRVEPAWTSARLPRGWRRARHHLQLAETYTIDLRKSEADILEPMSRKHRQYIRKSERDGVSVRRETGQNLDAMFDIYTDTARRAGFGIHPKHYYEALHRGLGTDSQLYIAEYNGRPVAFLWLATGAKTAYELYGGVVAEGAELKANYFLKWQAIATLKAAGYETYDFNGRLNEGVSRFKDGFGPDATDYVGTWDYPLNRAGYHAWERLWPVVKVVGRRVSRLKRG